MPSEKRNNRVAVYFTKSELSLLESEKERLNEDSTSKVIVKICKDYFKKLEAESSGDVEGADLREEVLDFFRSDEGRELVKEFVEKMKKE